MVDGDMEFAKVDSVGPRGGPGHSLPTTMSEPSPAPGSSTWAAARTGKVALGHGTHLCAGAALARWETETDEEHGSLTPAGRTKPLTDRLGPQRTRTLPPSVSGTGTDTRDGRKVTS